MRKIRLREAMKIALCHKTKWHLGTQAVGFQGSVSLTPKNLLGNEVFEYSDILFPLARRLNSVQ